MSKKPISELIEGDVIDPPYGERAWLWKDGVKRRYTVRSVEQGERTKRGQFMKIRCVCPSPYRNEELFNINCQMLECKMIKVY